jgi:hypothetical protein
MLKVMRGYFFFEPFLLLLEEDFFDDEALELLFFDAAMALTTFHAVRDLPVALSWHNAPDCSGKIAFGFKETSGDDG